MPTPAAGMWTSFYEANWTSICDFGFGGAAQRCRAYGRTRRAVWETTAARLVRFARRGLHAGLLCWQQGPQLLGPLTPHRRYLSVGHADSPARGLHRHVRHPQAAGDERPPRGTPVPGLGARPAPRPGPIFFPWPAAHGGKLLPARSGADCTPAGSQMLGRGVLEAGATTLQPPLHACMVCPRCAAAPAPRSSPFSWTPARAWRG